MPFSTDHADLHATGLSGHPRFGGAGCRIRVISPHRDDAALSIGCTLNALARQGAELEIVSCFTRSGWAPKTVSRMSAEEVTRLRAEEDAEYGVFCGIGAVTGLDLPDSSLREDGPGARAVSDLPEEAVFERWVGALADRLHCAAEERQALLFLPMGVGHRDHVITREAGIRVAEGRSLLFYEDVPYVLFSSNEQLAQHRLELERRIGERLYPLALPPWGADRWLQGVRSYRSQFAERDFAAMARLLEKKAGERVWATEAVAGAWPIFGKVA